MFVWCYPTEETHEDKTYYSHGDEIGGTNKGTNHKTLVVFHFSLSNTVEANYKEQQP
ncbi:hypothetical protein GCM10011343_12750 [Flavobacterium orientale]|uniref:Uncharacterized protein n=1 Tax=Flavobacterium orientale TaxID=1756020 RepID=A0A916XZQ3_9FLAO|nr:hypothetical protein GCM10011343_12750 [Flavobacterium orientale]